MDSRPSKFCFFLLVLYAAIHFSSYYSQLPDVVQSHFNREGIPNGWQSKPVFFFFFVGVTVLATFITFGLPALVRSMPTEIINLPHKDFWLSPQRRSASFDFLATWFAWFGCAVFLVILITFDYAVQSNLHPDNRPDPTRFLYVLFAFLAFTLLWIFRLALRFSRLPQDS
jgi:uncharacterized membrane protein